MGGRQITIIGGGFSGLVSAYYLQRKGHSLKVYERSDRVGGLISSHRTAYGLVETAANGILNSSLLEELCDDLGVTLLRTRKESRARYIYRSGLRRWPLQMGETLMFLRGVLKIAGTRALSKNRLMPKIHESLGDWTSQRLGRAAVDYLVSPALQGIYASSADQLSAELLLPWTRRQPTVFESRRLRYGHGTVAPKNGMGELTKSLFQFLQTKGVNFVFDSSNGAREIGKKPVLISTGISTAADLLEIAVPELARALKKVEKIDIVTMTLFFPKEATYKKGFGCLFPRSEGFNSLGVLFNQNIFDFRSDYQSETWILAGTAERPLSGTSPAEILDWILKDRQRLWKIDLDPLHYDLSVWPQALPLYDQRLAEAIQISEQLPPNVRLCGNYLGGLGLKSILAQAYHLGETWPKRLGSKET